MADEKNDDGIVTRVQVRYETVDKPVTRVAITYEGAVDRAIARAVPPDVAHQFEDAYLCPNCGQDGAVDRTKLKPGGTAECPQCGAAMTPSKGGA